MPMIMTSIANIPMLIKVRYEFLFAPITNDSFMMIPFRNPSLRCSLDWNLYSDDISNEFWE
jgi:hypothetical protein